MTKGKETAPRSRQQRQLQRRTLIVVGVVIALAIVGAVVLAAGNNITTQANLLPDPALGPQDAPVTIIEYGDLGCTTCRNWHKSGIRDALFETYGDQIRFEFRDFPVITTQSPNAAIAGQCAHQQGRFWEFHDYVYENYQGLFEPELLMYASEVNLDVSEFQACLGGGTRSLEGQSVQADWNGALELGFTGTPTFLINGQRVTGPPSFELMSDIIDEELAQSS